MIEVLVVLTIATVVLLAALPLFIDVSKEGRKLTGEALTGDPVGTIHERLSHDFASAKAIGVSVPFGGAVVVVLSPKKPEDPTVTYEIASTWVRRLAVFDPTLFDEPPKPFDRTWRIAGTITVLPAEIGQGRLVLVVSDPKDSGPAAVFAFPLTPVSEGGA